MSLAIGVTFLTGRFHATPWGLHVNAGQPEWPPSPWRFLRALIAAWKRNPCLNKDIDRAMPHLIEKMLKPPVFKLPQASLGHAKHYMPWHKNWNRFNPGKARTEVFDSFVVMNSKDEVIIIWPDLILKDSEENCLKAVLSQMHYLGRAESWCSARIVEMPKEDEINCHLVAPSDAGLLMGYEAVQVLCPDPDSALANDHTPKRSVHDHMGQIEIPVYDPDWHLCFQTLDLHKARWSDVPGSHWVNYYRRSDAFAVGPSIVHEVASVPNRVIAACFLIDGKVLPSITDTVYVGELARQALQSRFGKLENGSSSSLLSGKRADGEPLKEHQHTFFLPTDDDGDGKLDHLTIYCRSHFGNRELRAIDSFRRMRTPGGGLELDLLLVGLIEAHTDHHVPSVALLRKSTKWRSVTPFVPTRHYKKRGQKRDTCSIDQFAEVVLREELRRRRLPEAILVRPLSRCILFNRSVDCASHRTISWLQFRQQRVFGEGRRGTHPGCGFEIEFPEPVSGPLALGYGCHFGLGLFAPAE